VGLPARRTSGAWARDWAWGPKLALELELKLGLKLERKLALALGLELELEVGQAGGSE
jgi:hypothetical protein